MKLNINTFIWIKLLRIYFIYTLVFISFHQRLLCQTIEIWPTRISFNYETGNSNDALAIAISTGGQIPAPEYLVTTYYTKHRNFAYIINQSNRKIKVMFDCNTSNVNFLVKATIISGTGIGNVCEQFVSACDINTNEIIFEISGSIPGTVGKRTFTWEWEAIALPTSYPYCPTTCVTATTEHTYYTLLSTPASPMGIPWTSVLNYSCEWASGLSESSQIAQKIVEGLYNRPEFKYDTIGGASRYTGKDTAPFNLTMMLNDFGEENINVNCYDMGKALNIFINALGGNSSYVLTDPFGYLNCIKPIGLNWTNNPFCVHLFPPYNVPIVGEDLSYPNRTDFSRHAFCIMDNNIYDACLKVDIDENPDSPPHTELWATGWSWNDYKLKVIDDNPSSNTGTPEVYTFTVY